VLKSTDPAGLVLSLKIIALLFARLGKNALAQGYGLLLQTPQERCA